MGKVKTDIQRLKENVRQHTRLFVMAAESRTPHPCPSQSVRPHITRHDTRKYSSAAGHKSGLTGLCDSQYQTLHCVTRNSGPTRLKLHNST